MYSVFLFKLEARLVSLCSCVTGYYLFHPCSSSGLLQFCLKRLGFGGGSLPLIFIYYYYF